MNSKITLTHYGLETACQLDNKREWLVVISAMVCLGVDKIYKADKMFETPLYTDTSFIQDVELSLFKQIARKILNDYPI